MRYDTMGALLAKCPNCTFSFNNNAINYWDPNNSIEQPTLEQISEWIVELEAEEPMRLLRIERNRKIAETDWWASSDLTMTQERLEYRQALRDITVTQTPTMNEYGDLTGITWPTKPE